MLISSGTLVSKCCQAVILMDGNEYECSKCLKHCEAGGTIGDLHAPKAERARLERELIEAAKEEYRVERESDRGPNTIARTEALRKLQPLMQKRREAVAKLVEFESLQEKKG